MAFLFDVGIFAANDSSGASLAGAKLTFYETGTTAAKDTYQTSALSSLSKNTNPVVADGNGRWPAIWLDLSDGLYTVKFEPSDGSFSRSRDDIGISAATLQVPGGGSIQDGLWRVGNSASIAGSKAKINWLRDNASFPAENEAGIWTGATIFDHAIDATFDGSVGGAGGPAATLFAMANANGTASDVVAFLCSSIARTNNSRVFGANIIARNVAGNTGSTLVGLEIDWTPSTGTTTASDSGALFINSFSLTCPVGIQFGGVGGGDFNIGIAFYGIKDSGGAALVAGSGETMGSFINTNAATSFTEAAIAMGQNHRLRMYGSSISTFAEIFNTAGDALFIVGGANGAVLRNNANSANNVVFENTGSVDLQAGGTIKFANSLSSGTATAGAATLPANPVGFLSVVINGTTRKLPYYAS